MQAPACPPHEPPAQRSALLLLTHCMRLMRGIVLCDANFDDMRPDLLALAAFAEATLSATTLRFRKRLD